MTERQNINNMYYCGRVLNDARISVFTGNSYLVAEYSERSGETRWQRVVAAAQKEGIHEWLRTHYPPQTGEAPKVPSRKAAVSSR